MLLYEAWIHTPKIVKFLYRVCTKTGYAYGTRMVHIYQSVSIFISLIDEYGKKYIGG
jgi:hypothetical protein